MKKIFLKIGVACLSFFVALTALFVPLKKPNINSASALSSDTPIYSPDSTVVSGLTFTGSDLFYIFPSRVNSNTLITDFNQYIYGQAGVYIDTSDVIGLRFNLVINENNFYLQYKAVKNIDSYIVSDVQNIPTNLGVPLNTISVSNFGFSSLSNNFVANQVYKDVFITPMQLFYDKASYEGAKYVNFGLEVYKDNSSLNSYVNPSFKMITIELTNSLEFQSSFGYAPSFPNCNIIRYTDDVGYSFTIYIPSGVNFSNSSVPLDYQTFSYRKYLLPSYYDLNDNDFYTQGVQDGYNKGYLAGETGGYNNGYKAGKIDGFNAGKIEGANQANTYTFTSLIGAVVDVPLNAFKSLFNFDILGINLFNFFSALLTCCLIIFILKLALGGK